MERLCSLQGQLASQILRKQHEPRPRFEKPQKYIGLGHRPLLRYGPILNLTMYQYYNQIIKMLSSIQAPINYQKNPRFVLPLE